MLIFLFLIVQLIYYDRTIVDKVPFLFASVTVKTHSPPKPVFAIVIVIRNFELTIAADTVTLPLLTLNTVVILYAPTCPP